MYSIYMEMVHDSSHYYSQFQLSFKNRKRNYSKESKRLIIFSLYSVHRYSNCYSIRRNFPWNEPISLHVEQSSFSSLLKPKIWILKILHRCMLATAGSSSRERFLIPNWTTKERVNWSKFLPWWVLINLTTMTNWEITVPICLPTNCYNM